MGDAMLSGADLLFPSDLSVTPSGIGHILLLGSCGMQVYEARIKALHPGLRVDFLFSGSHSILPDVPPSPIAAYDFMVVQLPLRDVLPDAVIRFKDFVADGAMRRDLSGHGLDLLRQAVERSLRYNREHGLLTIVANFPEPVRSTSPTMRHVAGALDLASLVAALNRELAALVSAHENAFVADWNALTAALGKASFNDDIFNFYTHTSPWSAEQYEEWEQGQATPRIEPLERLDGLVPSTFDEMFHCVWRQWEAIYRTSKQIDQVKLVIFDLDNTLWRGQIAEDYGDADDAGDGRVWPVHHGWPTGLWEAIQHLRARGILVALCSKNEEEVVARRWDRAVLPAFLRLDDFVIREINWKPKAENVARIIERCSLTAGSVVFVDDNPVEREAVRLGVPGVRVIGRDPRMTRRILLWSSETQIPDLTGVTLAREDMIARAHERDTLRSFSSREEFLRGLECAVSVHCGVTPGSALFTRAVELVNKTNQFNTTGRRWTLAELRSHAAEGGEIVTFAARDRFSEHGTVGVVILEGTRLRQVVMSCRVIGLAIEDAVIASLAERDASATFSGEVEETELNLVCRDVFRRCGFREDANRTGRFVAAAREIKRIPDHVVLTVVEEAEKPRQAGAGGGTVASSGPGPKAETSRIVRLARRALGMAPLVVKRKRAARLLADGRFAEVDELLRGLARHRDADPALLRLHAFSAHNSGRYEEACRRWTELRARHADDPMAWVGLAANLRELGRLDEARVQIDEAMRLFPDDLVAITEGLRVYDAQGDRMGARRLADRACELRPEEPQWARARATRLAEMGP